MPTQLSNQAGDESYIFSNGFFETGLMHPLALIIAIFIFSKKESYRAVRKVVLPAMCFNIAPEDFFIEVGSNVASNFYNDYVQDISLMKEIGLNSVRTSIQWTRLIKNFETAEVDEGGVKFYNAVIDEFLKKIFCR